MSDIPGRSARPLQVGTTHVVTLRGDLDLLAAPALRARRDMLTAGPCPDLVLDLRPVSFIDCSGLGVLCRVRNRVRARHGRLRLVTGSASLRRVQRHTGMAGGSSNCSPACRWGLPAHPRRTPSTVRCCDRVTRW
ncbi:STAS domain-containing protein [Streptomyces luteogriseus]|uniref:STAS domain-containing protein n=1 Tax=Streptomyces luteogriseus TaxID=68233 RepID=UPI0027D8E7C0|nr:STAS domain-containing protein [Streptomyces luteogriseus]